MIEDRTTSTHTATVDRYLETIYYIAAEGDVVRPSRLSNWLGVSAPTVSEALRRLERDGWITTAPDRSVTLTSDGESIARAIDSPSLVKVTERSGAVVIHPSRSSRRSASETVGADTPSQFDRRLGRTTSPSAAM